MSVGSEEYFERIRSLYPTAFELAYAVLHGTPDEVRDRLARGDDPEARGPNGGTLLTTATRFEKDLPKAAILFEAGARIDAVDDLGMQPILWSTYDTACLTWLLERGADVNARVGPSASTVMYPPGFTPLHVAAHHRLIPATELLIAWKADANAAAADGSTPLHVACRTWKLYKRQIRLLVDAGADVDAVDATGATPLHCIAGHYAKHRKEAIRFLVHRCARRDLCDNAGRLPIELVRGDDPESDDIRKLLQVPHAS